MTRRLVWMVPFAFAGWWMLSGFTLDSDGKMTGIEVRDREQLFHRLKHVRAKRPDDPVNTFRLGNLYYSLEMEDEAIKEYRRCLKLDEHHAQAKWFLSHVLVSKGYLEEAFRLTRDLLDRFPDDPKLYAWAGDILVKLEQPVVAREYYAREDELTDPSKRQEGQAVLDLTL